ncbi:MAG: phosphoribosylaminoimidazolesuccinocarboxamide synthase [Saprospiraceae bacterium]|nr:phosphoribosylaminoimidazolesuccinocarboxamide synthase [Saprospiraceae bacterium]
MENNTIFKTNFTFDNQTSFYQGKVRDVYTVDNQLIVIATDRISAFDFVLPKPIPFKGQVLNQIATYFLERTRDIIPNWLISSPDENVSVGMKCEPFKIEVVVRGYLAGHAWREYSLGKRKICGVQLPDGLKEGDKLPHNIITPSTKSDKGHDEDISKEDLIGKNIIDQKVYEQIEEKALALFDRGSEIANERNLILVDTKYEFGKLDDQIILIDEIHTPDSSRYYVGDGYLERQEQGIKQIQLSKEFVREWLMAHNFQGKDGQEIPNMPDDFINQISSNYINLYEKLTGKQFIKADANINSLDRIKFNLSKAGFTFLQ